MVSVHNSFLEGDLLKDLYMQIPKGFSKPIDLATHGENQIIFKLHNPLFGLKKAPRQ